MSDPARYLLEILDSTTRALERRVGRLERDTADELETLHKMLGELRAIRNILEPPPPPAPVPTSITFTQTS